MFTLQKHFVKLISYWCISCEHIQCLMIIQDWLIGLDQGLVTWLMIVSGARLAKKIAIFIVCFLFLSWIWLSIHFHLLMELVFAKELPTDMHLGWERFLIVLIILGFGAAARNIKQVHVQVDLLRIKLVILFKRQATVQSPLSFNHPTPKVKWLHELWKKLVFDHKENASTSSYYLVSIDIWILTNSTNGFHLS